MKFKKLKKIVAVATVLATFFTTTATSAATTTKETVTDTVAKSLISTNLSSSYSSLNENVLKVNIDDYGAVNYSVPVSTTGLEDKDFSWDNALVYFVITDRFVNGDKSNDHSYGRSVGEVDADKYETRSGTFHGGDLKGLTSKIEDGYFDDLGINAIWITAPYEQIHGAVCANGFKHYAYHGYWALDFSNMDANMGTEEDLEKFVDTAHSHGIRVVMDVVMNHFGYTNPVDADHYKYGKLVSDWRKIYYDTPESSYKWSMDYTGGKDASAQDYGMMIYDGDWSTNYFGNNWVRLLGDRFNGFNGVENQGDEMLYCSDGLPDIKTENQNEVSLPPILVTKWKEEGRYDKEMAELNEYFAKGHRKTTVEYMTKWLTDWVREYGIDGFRCDTAKHIQLSAWKNLKTEGVKALNEWRQNNPNKPGAQWTDDFWMTGECWNWKVESYSNLNNDSYFTQGGFDSMINFGFRDQGIANKSGADLINSYEMLASKTTNSKYNALSYMSSHDTSLSRGNNIQMGTSLVLAPGGVQIFYGDETNRQAHGEGGSATRSQMNWDSMDKNLLAHYQKLGTFRNNHLAVGAGKERKLDSTTVARTYSNNGVEDKVVISFPSSAGSVTVPVGDVFKNGEEVKDAYTGKSYRVSGGNVTVEADTNKVVLLESTGAVEPYVSVSPSSKNYYDEAGVEVTLTYHENVTNAKYSIDGGTAKSFTSGTKITVGAGKEDGTTTTVTVTGTANGKTLTDTATYTKIPKPKTLTVHIKDTTNAGPYNAYVYSKDETTKYAGPWPGTAMTAESNGWYVYETEATTTGLVIYNGSWGQYPGAKEPGIEVTGEVWIKDKVSYDHNPEQEEEGKVIVKYVDNDGNQIASSKTLTGIVGKSYSTSALSIDGYTLTSTPSNASGTYTKADITVTYVYKENSNLDVKGHVSVSSPQSIGASIVLSADVTGSQGTVQYEFTVIDAKGNEKTVKSYSEASVVTWKPSAAGTYTIKIKAKDSKNTAITTINNYVIKAPSFTITSATSSVASPQKSGTAIKLTTNVKGGEGTIKYRFVVVRDGEYKTVIQDYTANNSVTWIPNKAGKYNIYFKVKDSTGKELEVKKSFVITAPSFAITSTTTSVASPQNAGSNIKLTANTIGGEGTVKYRFVAVRDGEYKTVIQDYSTNNSVTWTPKVAGTYNIYFKAIDSTGKELEVKKSSYVIKAVQPIVINSLTPNKLSPQMADTSIKLTANVIAQNSVTYKFWAYSAGGQWKALSDFTSNNYIEWKPSIGGYYTIGVDVKDNKGNIVTKVVQYLVTDKFVTVEQDNSKINYSGDWKIYTGKRYSNQSKVRSDNEGDIITFKFTGTGIGIKSTTDKDRGIASVTIDGIVYSVDMYSSETVFQAEIFKITGLNNTTHTITIKNEGLASNKSSGKIIDIDAFNIYNGNIK